MIITIGGRPGSGKSTVAKLLATKLGFKHYSTGDIWRAIVKERGISLEESQRLNAKTNELDKLVDTYQKELGMKEDNFVLDGRLGWFFIPQSTKIFLDVDPQVAAQRIFKDTREGKRSEQAIKDVEEAMRKSNERDAHDAKRYKELYTINFQDSTNFDLVIDTSVPTAEEIVKRIMRFIKKSGS